MAKSFAFWKEPAREKNEDDQLVTDREYYRALYHLVTHWAAVVMMFVLLLTLAAVGTPSASAAPTSFRAAIAVITLLSVYFFLRMNSFGNIVNQGVNRPAAPARLVVGGILVVLLGAYVFWNTL